MSDRISEIKKRLEAAPRSSHLPHDYLGYHPGWAGDDIAYLISHIAKLETENNSDQIKWINIVTGLKTKVDVMGAVINSARIYYNSHSRPGFACCTIDCGRLGFRQALAELDTFIGGR